MPRFSFTSFRKSVAHHSKGFGCLRDGQAGRLNTLLQHDKAGVRRVFHGHGRFLSVVIDIINVLRAAVKAKNHPPVGAYCNGPEAFRRAFERMQSEPRQIHVGDGSGGVKRRQNIPKLADVFRVYAARVVLFRKPFQSLVAVAGCRLSAPPRGR